MTQSPTAHAISLQQTLKTVENNIIALGPGPYSAEQGEKLKELNQLKQRLLSQMSSASQQVPSVQYTIQKSQLNISAQNQSAGIIPGMIDVNSIKTEVKPIVLTHGTQAAQVHVPSAGDDKILNKQRLQELVREIDPNEQLDDDVEEMLMQITDDFIENVVGAGCDLAKHRNGTVLEVKDLKLHLDNRWNISVPGYASDEIKPFKKPVATEAHRQRLALIKKASKK